MNSRERVHLALNHQEADHVPLDLGGSLVTGMNVSMVYKLRQEIEALRAEFATLTQRWDASQSAGTAYTAEQEIPPHY